MDIQEGYRHPNRPSPLDTALVHEGTGPVARGNMCEAHIALYVRYIKTHHYYY